MEPGGPCTLPQPETSVQVAILPHAQGGEVDRATYRLIDLPGDGILTFDPGTRRLTHTHASAPPILGTPSTYRYLAGAAGVDAANADDALCLDVQYNPGGDICPGDSPESFIHITLRIRDDAYLDGNEWRCPDTTAAPPRSAAQGVSNPVHEALGPVHARRALEVAHGSLRDGVRAWTPRRSAHALRDRAQSRHSLALRAERRVRLHRIERVREQPARRSGPAPGRRAWSVPSPGPNSTTVPRERLAERGYRSGESTTEIFSLHPFAAWHPAAGGDVWMSLGAGTGELRHRDELGFPSWSRSEVRLRAYAAGASVPVADFLAGELEAEAGIEAFAFEIEGGGRISSALPTLRGRDWRTGLAWSAPVAGAPRCRWRTGI